MKAKAGEVLMDLPLPPSVNHAYRNAVVKGVSKKGKPYSRRVRVKTDATERWEGLARDACIDAARGWVITPKGVKVVLELWVHWPDARRRDTHNLHKVLCDTLEGILYEDDQFVLVRDMDFDVDRVNPRVTVRLSKL